MKLSTANYLRLSEEIDQNEKGPIANQSYRSLFAGKMGRISNKFASDLQLILAVINKNNVELKRLKKSKK